MSKDKKKEQNSTSESKEQKYTLHYPTLSRRALVKDRELVSKNLIKASNDIQELLKK